VWIDDVLLNNGTLSVPLMEGGHTVVFTGMLMWHASVEPRHTFDRYLLKFRKLSF
jgi:hypothetical protein